MPTRWCLFAVLLFAIPGRAQTADAPAPSAGETRDAPGSKLVQIADLIQAADHLDAAAAGELARQARQRASALIEAESARLAREQAILDDLSHALKQTQIAVQVLIADAPNLRAADLAREIVQLGGERIDPESASGADQRDDGVLAAYLRTATDGPKVLRSLRAVDPNLNVLSRPQVMTLDGVAAQIQIGEAIPIVNGVTVSREGALVPLVAEDHAGIRLSVTPSAVSEGRIRLELDVERSSFLKDGVPILTNPATGESITAPIKSIASAQATFMVPEERMLLLAVPASVHGAPARAGEQGSRSALLVILEPRVLTERP